MGCVSAGWGRDGAATALGGCKGGWAWRLQGGGLRNLQGFAERECGVRSPLIVQARAGPLSSVPCLVSSPRHRPTLRSGSVTHTPTWGGTATAQCPGRAAGLCSRTSRVLALPPPRPTMRPWSELKEQKGQQAPWVTRHLHGDSVCRGREGGKQGQAPLSPLHRQDTEAARGPGEVKGP